MSTTTAPRFDITTPAVPVGALITAHGAVIRELTADEEQRARAAVAQP